VNHPLSTGEVGQLLKVGEPRLNGLIRRGKIKPLPAIVFGRRAWSPDHIVQAARALGLPEEEVERIRQSSQAADDVEHG